jgi:hypothetical protein
LIMSDSPPPDYMKLYDVERNINEKLRKELQKLSKERDQAIMDLQEALFIKADKIAKSLEEHQHFTTSDPHIITNAILELRKILMKSGVKIHKIKTVTSGDIIVEIQYET